ncbi:MAG: helix-turn-helix transcriptional regulator [Eubacteriales bacterium]|nr:helix-turn-helix transcriptional regulator [Eubacteriales bacterium]
MKHENNITAENIGGNIRRLRMEHGETQEQLGEFLGYGATTIANYESGYRLPDLLTFLQIAFHYDATLEEFVK